MVDIYEVRQNDIRYGEYTIRFGIPSVDVIIEHITHERMMYVCINKKHVDVITPLFDIKEDGTSLRSNYICIIAYPNTYDVFDDAMRAFVIKALEEQFRPSCWYVPAGTCKGDFDRSCFHMKSERPNPRTLYKFLYGGPEWL